MKNQSTILAEIIVDLYEIRASTLPWHFTEKQMDIDSDFTKYNFLNAIIAQLYEKYKINNEDVKKIKIRRERRQDLKMIDNMD